MEKIAVIGAVLSHPETTQVLFNQTVAAYKNLIKGRMGIPFDKEDTAVIAITLQGGLDEINALTGKLGKIEGVSVKTAISDSL
ncbi:MAG: iron-only hydrogenase system regulator [Treponema sp.]|jgi:putative iron-only hydrogenase system regulator|nr:iron-only hydrogenase system regulator [Treponema sp.]